MAGIGVESARCMMYGKSSVDGDDGDEVCDDQGAEHARDREQVVAGGWAGRGVGLAGRRCRRVTITGTVTFDGKAPALKPLAMDAEPVCHKMHGGKPVPNEMLVLGSGNTMGNIMVWVSKGLPAGKT